MQPPVWSDTDWMKQDFRVHRRGRRRRARRLKTVVRSVNHARTSERGSSGPATFTITKFPPGCARPLPWLTSRERSGWPVHAVVMYCETWAAGTVTAAA